MNILTICSALNNSYLGIKYNDKEIIETIKSDENYHSLYLISKIKELLEKNNIKLKDIDIIGVNCGPGSFTGIRVALSIAKIIAGELNKPLVNLNTAEILLTAFNCDTLLMDARRDMYFVGTKEDIKLVYKDKIEEEIQNKNLLCDKRCFESYPTSTCFELEDKNLSSVMLKLTEDKFKNSSNVEEFNYLNIQANYIQTPPVF
ncbi:MAG: tRNA (adenosine(37)-N6)-threonylcarbamoyltransferase complex dimerization subunit type 1 TsaB [Candidatus Gastranaerophilales bacterium]|nr:tRNA (adenosine(37)-N6)-threonylcarbamoyltransferase complex dimerization subunit type 1 TsaB [Candidatus Gastranaerophilales bacterium]